MPRLTYSRQAEADLLDNHSWVATQSLKSASALVRRIDRACRLLAERPCLGVRRDHLRSGLRQWMVGAFLVLYRAEADGIFVVRVVHGRRDLNRLLED